MQSVSKKIGFITCILFLSISMYGCSQDVTKDMSLEEKNTYIMGDLNGTRYSNDNLMFVFDLPEDWYHLTSEELQKETMVLNDESLNKDTISTEGFDASTQDTLCLAAAFEENPYSSEYFSPSIAVLAEELSLLQSKTLIADDYLDATMQYNEDEDIAEKYEVVSKETVNLSRLEFSCYKTEMRQEADAPKIFQDYYCRIDQGYAIVYILTYMEPYQEEALNTSLQSYGILIN